MQGAALCAVRGRHAVAQRLPYSHHPACNMGHALHFRRVLEQQSHKWVRRTGRVTQGFRAPLLSKDGKEQEQDRQGQMKNASGQKTQGRFDQWLAPHCIGNTEAGMHSSLLCSVAAHTCMQQGRQSTQCSRAPPPRCRRGWALTKNSKGPLLQARRWGAGKPTEPAAGDTEASWQRQHGRA